MTASTISKRLGKLIVVSAPSGAGKSTLIDLLRKDYPELGYSISATTRKPREGEVNGLHYHFKSHPEFEKMIEANELVEYNEVHGNFYGTPKSELEKRIQNGLHTILDLDVYGKTNFDKVYPKADGILILPPSIEILKERLDGRALDSEDTIALRVSNAQKEMEYAVNKGKYEFEVINNDLKDAHDELKSIVGGIIG